MPSTHQHQILQMWFAVHVLILHLEILHPKVPAYMHHATGSLALKSGSCLPKIQAAT